LTQYSYKIPSREEILSLLRASFNKENTNTLAVAFNINLDETKILVKRLSAMERDGQIELDQNANYSLTKCPNLTKGRINNHRDGYGFLTPEDGTDDIFLPEKEIKKVLHGDQVQVRIVGGRRCGRLEGKIVEVLAHVNTHVIGRLSKKNGAWVVIPEDKNISKYFVLTCSPGKAKINQIVNVQIIEQPSRYTQPTGKIIEIIGDENDPGIEVEVAVRKYGIPHKFSRGAKKLASTLPEEIDVIELGLGDRVDLRHLPLITIDGEDARDFDDAVYCESTRSGCSKEYRLIVAIADVSHYIKPNDALDIDALRRGTSVYFPSRVIPMLPEKISNGICSLNPGVDRFALVCDATIDIFGKIKSYQFYPAVINSRARLSYTEAAEILNKKSELQDVKRSELALYLTPLYAVFEILLKARQERGAIDFETIETQIFCDSTGKIKKILPRTRNYAHKMIEECMLVANVCAANLMECHKHPGLFRIHALPTKEKTIALRAFLRQFNLNLTGGGTSSATDYANLMTEIKLRPDALLLQTMLLRSMQQAVYSPKNIGHFGLSYGSYTHFTSPIRRYPDLLTHRVIKSILRRKIYNPSCLNETFLLKEKNQDGKPMTWTSLGVYCSTNERRAEEATRNVEAWLKCYFIRDKIGEKFTGVVSSITGFGIFVQLNSLHIEGLVHITELGRGHFQYNEANHELLSNDTGIHYRIADQVTVQIKKVDLNSCRINFCLINKLSSVKKEVKYIGRDIEKSWI